MPRNSLSEMQRSESGRANGADLLAQIRLDIVNGYYEPKAKLKFADLTARYDVSIGTLREALTHLASEGFVSVEVGRGFRVAPVSRDELIEITDLYVEFETRALADAIRHGDDEWQAQIVAAYHRLTLIHDLPKDERLNRHVEWVKRHRAFHDALVAASRQPWLLRLRALMYHQTDRYRYLSKLSTDRAIAKNAEHREIMEATLEHDTARACALMDRHIRETTETVLSVLR